MSGFTRGEEIDRLIHLLAKLPGLGPRSARRAALALLKKRETLLEPLADALAKAAAALKQCSTCGNLDTTDPCALCRDPARDGTAICVVEDVDDLWALERAGIFRGRYHVSAARSPRSRHTQTGSISESCGAACGRGVKDPAMNATVEGQPRAL